ncbi:MAG TPA: PQQ-binding-like beta-propeller repeat protein [Polyangiaceae bacterium]|nr:PQQ-binding-like beta-propeller repeat protein [Polyangiaceae bacterium]
MSGLSLVTRSPRPGVPTRTSARELLEHLLEAGGSTGNAPNSPPKPAGLAAAAKPPAAIPSAAVPGSAAEHLDGLLEPLSEIETHSLLCELAHAAADLASGARARGVVRVCAGPDPWELGIERAGRDVLATLFQGGAVPAVALHERRIDGDLFCDRIAALLDQSQERAQEKENPRLASARQRINASRPFAREEGGPALPSPEPALVSIEPTGEIPLVIAADITLRGAPDDEGDPEVQRSDLFSLLFRGRLRVTVGGQARELPDVFVFLVAEQLEKLALEALDAWTRSRAYHRRVLLGGAVLGVRLEDETHAARDSTSPTDQGAPLASLTLGTLRREGRERPQTWTFPAVDVGALVQAVVAFGRALSRSLVRRDRSQASNYRLYGFRARIRELNDRLREATRDDSKINTSPESYRAFAEMSRPSATADDTFGRTRLRFSARWLTTVPGIDLRATFLCGDVLVASGAREVACIDRRTGELVWCRPEPRAVSVITPLGLARLLPDGSLRLHDLATGDIRWTTRLKPRAGASASGAVVSAPGLPRLLIVSEGTRHLAAIDLYSGEVRWRFAARRGGVFRLKRAGKLAILTSGEPALTALDVLTGEVVWRFCDRLRFVSGAAVDQDALFACAGDGALVGRGGARLHHIDPWSGAVKWSVELPAHAAPVGAPLLAPETVVVASHGRRGTSLVGFDRKTGAPRFDLTASSTAASCLVVDDLILVNSEGGELIAIDAGTGRTRYRHVFSNGVEGDRPRRLEPVLRSGALFVPQSEVHVVRPRDGTLLGKLPTDLIPDLLRVDERCDVYVAEESGHLGAFAAAARLSLVQ